jgi:hypothetical protein
VSHSKGGREWQQTTSSQGVAAEPLLRIFFLFFFLIKKFNYFKLLISLNF